MNLEQHTQVNSAFFFSEHLTFNVPKGYKKVSFKDFDEDFLSEQLESFVFGDDNKSFFHIKTNKGDFIFLNVTNDIKKDQIIEYLKENSTNYPTYYFRNVDYFSFGQFGYAENGKIERYLSFNSEALENENVVEWIGKPHKWEYSSHTFYSKKKLEDFEMFFDSDAVCDMISFYLPFTQEDLEILEFNCFSADKKYANQLKKSFEYKPLKLEKKSIKNLYYALASYSISCAVITVNLYEDKIIMHDLMLNTIDDEGKDIMDSKILFYNLVSKIKYNDKHSEIIFHNSLLQLIEAIANCEIKGIKEVAPYVKSVEENEKEVFFIAISVKQKKKLRMELIKKGEDRNRFILYNLSKKNSHTIYQYLKKHL